MAPVVVRARIVSFLKRTVKSKVESANFSEVMSLHVSSDARNLRSLIWIVHAVEIFDRVFDHPCFLRKNISQEGFHNLDLFWFASVRQSIFEGGNEFHGKMGILGFDTRNVDGVGGHCHYDNNECRNKAISASTVDHCGDVQPRDFELVGALSDETFGRYCMGKITQRWLVVRYYL